MRRAHAGLAISILISGLFAGFNPAFAKKTPKQVAPPVQVTDWAEAQTPLKAHISTVLAPVFPDKQWWEKFEDPNLTAYISAAIQNNPTLNAALLRVAESRALAGQNIAKELPSITFNPGVTRLGLPDNIGGGKFPSSLALFNLPFQASYELDIWGKNLDRIRSAKRRTEAAEFDSRAVLNTIVGDVASAYVNLLRTDELIQTQKENLKLLQRIEELKASLQQIGLISMDEVLRAKRDVTQAQTDLSTYQQQQALFAHQLSILTGSPPAAAEHLKRGVLDALTLPQQTSVGLPAELITRRPDILAQERRLEQARLDVQIARKAFLPSINLSAMLGLGSGSLGSLFSWSNFFNLISGTASQPVFQGGKLKAELKASKIKQKEQLENYRQTILTALKDVEDSLALLRAGYEHLDSSNERLELTEHDLKLVTNRYQQGLVPHLDVLQAQSELLRYRQSAAQSKAEVAIATVGLYKALGGGF
jgi:NodT family efflux transporter outer membrane factor (OMF) lipoprotein